MDDLLIVECPFEFEDGGPSLPIEEFARLLAEIEALKRETQRLREVLGKIVMLADRA